MTELDLRDLDAFVAVARTRNFHHAAREQCVSASSLGQRLRDMAERLGVRLMHRTTCSVGLTEAGELLLARVGPAITDIGGARAGSGAGACAMCRRGDCGSMRRRRRSIWCWRRWLRRS
jgi:DNA-binding transcriptional LysR family regulator